MPLIKRKPPTDATGAAIDPEAVYTPLLPFARGESHEVYNPELSQLRGSHAAVLATPGVWVRFDASTDEKRRALGAYRAAKEAAQPTRVPDVPRTRIAQPIPQERRRVALRNYHDRAGRIVHEGSVWDANDEFVMANGDMFGPEAA